MSSRNLVSNKVFYTYTEDIRDDVIVHQLGLKDLLEDIYWK